MLSLGKEDVPHLSEQEDPSQLRNEGYVRINVGDYLL